MIYHIIAMFEKAKLSYSLLADDFLAARLRSSGLRCGLSKFGMVGFLHVLTSLRLPGFFHPSPSL